MEAFTERAKENETPWRTMLKNVRAFLNSYIFYGLIFFVGLFFVYMQREVQGVLLFVALLAVLLVVCEDILPTLFPFLTLCAFAANCYDSFDTFIVYAIYAPVLAACIAFHFVVYRKRYTSGESVKGIVAVSIALCLGGFGRYSVADYVKGAYYVFGLGIGMLAAYFLMKSQFSARRKYDLKTRFSVIMTLSGLFCFALMLVVVYCTDKRGYKFSPNNLATLLMFSLPFPLYLSKKCPWAALLTPILLGGTFFTGSRGGILFGCVEFALCIAYWISIGNKKRRASAIGVALVVVFATALAGRDALYEKIYTTFELSTIATSSRAVMIGEAVERFCGSPLVGTGLMDDSIAYSGGIKGTMAWYHMMIPQIIGSMGLVGLAAYGFQIRDRLRAIFTKKDAWSLCLGISYAGILLMSQVNPGEFCPIPFELLTVLLFIFQEERFVRKPLWEPCVS